MFERLGLSDAVKGVAARGFDQIESSQSYTPISLNPMPQIFQKFRFEDGLLIARQGQVPTAIRLSSAAWLNRFPHGGGPSGDAERSSERTSGGLFPSKRRI